MAVIFPANACRFFEILVPVVQFDLFDSEYTTELMYDFDYSKQRSLESEITD